MKIRRTLIGFVGLVLLLCLGIIILSVASNLSSPDRSQVTDRLNEQEKTRLSEALHLRQSLGDTVWPGWGQADIPVILYNEDYAFLVRYADPPPGWIKVPQNLARGGAWEPVPGDKFEGQDYYRQRLTPGITPQAFTVLVGNRWVASLGTREYLQISLGDPLRADFGPVFPYRVAARWLAGSSDKYITLILHESLHAYQGSTAPERFANAERVVGYENECRLGDANLRTAWQPELNLLAAAVEAKEDAESKRLARDFLAQRDTRRAQSNLPSSCVELEQEREWLEGLAKYTELVMWRAAASTPAYRPLSGLNADPDFKEYTEAEERWTQEINQIKFSGREMEDNSFYYSGMAQAALLNRLKPGWQKRILEQDTPLEDWLREIDQ